MHAVATVVVIRSCISLSLSLSLSPVLPYVRTWYVQQQAARKTKLFYSCQDQHFAKGVVRLKRLPLGRLVRLVTGHSSLNDHRHLVDPQISRSCRLCHTEPESFFHFFTQCVQTADLRRELLPDIPHTTATWTPQILLDFSYNPFLSGFLDPHAMQDRRASDDTGSESEGTLTSGSDSEDVFALD